MDLQQGLNSAWSGVAGFVPKLIGAIVIFIIGWIIAKVLASVAARLLSRIGFDRMLERSGLGGMVSGGSLQPSKLLAKIIYWAVLLFTLQFAFGVFGANPISDILSGIISYLPNVFVAVVIMVIAGALASVARDLVGNMLSGTAYGRSLGTAAWVGVLVFGAFAAINQLGIAPEIVNGLWWAVLTAAVGVTVVAVGGGGIPVARRYLERAGNSGSNGGGAATGTTTGSGATAGGAATSTTGGGTTTAGGAKTARGATASGTRPGSPDRANVGTYDERTSEERTTTEPADRADYEPRHAVPGEHDEVRPEDVPGPRDGVTRDDLRR